MKKIVAGIAKRTNVCYRKAVDVTTRSMIRAQDARVYIHPTVADNTNSNDAGKSQYLRDDPTRFK
jgi:hypothetical protein